MQEGENHPNLVDILLLYLAFFVLLYPVTCILAFFNIAKKPRGYTNSVRDVLGMSLEIMLSHFKVVFLSWLISSGIGFILALILSIGVGIIAKSIGFSDVSVDVFNWTQISVLILGQIVGYVVTIMIHNQEVTPSRAN